MSNKLPLSQWPSIFWETLGSQKIKRFRIVCQQVVYDWEELPPKWTLKKDKQTKMHCMWSNLTNLSGHLTSSEKDPTLQAVKFPKDASQTLTTDKYLWHRNHNRTNQISDWSSNNKKSMRKIVFSSLRRITNQKTKIFPLNVSRIANRRRGLMIETTKKCSKFRTLYRGVPKIQPLNFIPRKDQLVRQKSSPCSLQGKILKVRCVRIVKDRLR